MALIVVACAMLPNVYTFVVYHILCCSTNNTIHCSWNVNSKVSDATTCRGHVSRLIRMTLYIRGEVVMCGIFANETKRVVSSIADFAKIVREKSLKGNSSKLT